MDVIHQARMTFKTLKKKYGSQASVIMPETFNLRSHSEIKLFIEHFRNKKKLIKKPKFILKNHKQRQEGLKMVNNLKTINKK